ncbi:stalk domain-containing protein [Paenibacillus turpanensis]|uniref:stalk domain-containing protein n=1 Tax=Paenibacillus turpanensis TaxID=2689078 RepID=UPI0014079E2D|nr:stalk domain-containing protein [Paenibacillus turpanensis]
MKKKLSLVMLFTMLVSCFAAMPVMAAEKRAETINLINDQSGYQIIVENFIGVQEITAKDMDDQEFQTTVLVMQTPEKASDGSYPIFEVVTQDPAAHQLESFPGSYLDGQLGSFSGTFADGKLMYSPSFSMERDLKDIVEGRVFSFDFFVADKDGNLIFDVADMNFMFVNEGSANAAAPTQEAAAQQPSNAVAQSTASKVIVNGKEVAFEAYNIDGSNYFKLRDLAQAVNATDKQFEVGWDGANNAINLATKHAYTPDGNELKVSGQAGAKEALPTPSKIYVDGQEVQFTAYNINGNNYFKLRDLAQAIDFAVTWDGAANQVGINTAEGYTAN